MIWSQQIGAQVCQALCRGSLFLEYVASSATRMPCTASMHLGPYTA